MTTSKLTELQKKVVFECATEPPFQNEYWNEKREGIYVDVLFNKPIFASIHKFDFGTGWPSFYESIAPEELEEKEDLSHFMVRTEVRTKTGLHLGHIFEDGPFGKRYCLNSASIRFIAKENLFAEGFGDLLKLFSKNETIALAGGCFWGMEKMINMLDGVVKTRVGYCGGFSQNPSYKEVSTGKTGHAESVEVSFNPNDLTLENLLKYFFQIHDPTTKDRQGNDVGSQYRSGIFCYTENQLSVAENIKTIAQISGAFKEEITTEIAIISVFWQAEEEHQKYLQKNPSGYNCHFFRKDKVF